MNNSTQITRITSNNCGGKGAWIDNPLNSPRPGNEEWLGFKFSGGGSKRLRNTRRRALSRSRSRSKSRSRSRIKRSKSKTHKRMKYSKTKK